MISQERLGARITHTRTARREIVVYIAMGFIGAVILATLFAPVIAPYGPNVIDLSNILSRPSPQHLLGTDSVGRDILSRLLYGGRISLTGPAIVTVCSIVFGVPIGLAAGYKGGFTDSLISRVLDVVFSFPGLLLAIIIIATFGSGLVTAVGAISLGFVAVMARMVRNVTLSERERTYVEACKVEGFSGLRIAFGHILPNIVPVIAAQATVYFGYALLDLAGLAFLGLGVQPPASDWGQMLTTGRNDLALGAWWEVVSAAGAIGLTVIAVNLVGEFLGRKAGTQR